MTIPNKTLDEIRNLLNKQGFCVLATQSAEGPYCSLVAYAATDDGREIIFPTRRDTRKYENLKQNPRVSLLIDNRGNSASDLTEAQALTVLGAASDLGKNPPEESLALLLGKHPDLREFASDPACALIRIQVSNYLLVDHFQNVTEYRPKN